MAKVNANTQRRLKQNSPGGRGRASSSHDDQLREIKGRDARFRDLYKQGTRGDRPDNWSELDDDERAAWEAGEEDAALKRVKPYPAPKARAHGRSTKSPARRYSHPARRRRAVTAARKRSLKRAAQVVSPVAATQATTAGQVVFGSLVVVALYVVLQNVGPLGGVLGAASKALDWLTDPTKSIPHKS